MSGFLGVVLAETQDPQPEDGRPRDHAKNVAFQHPYIGSSEQIRLLNVVNTEGSSSKIECTLETVDVSLLPSKRYATLSYYWGQARTERDIHEICVDKQSFWVRNNLWNFFQSIRYFDIRMPIYIDAICLNQLDDEERGKQVKLMSLVYSNANHTHVWLGLPHPDQDLFVKTLRRQLPNDLATWTTESFIGLSLLFARKYWQRLWIVQELLLSHTIILHCGSSTFTWDELLRLTKLPLSKDFFERPENTSWWDAWNFTQPRDFSRSEHIEDRLFGGWRTALRLFHHRQDWLSRAEGVLNADVSMPQGKGFPLYEAFPAFKSQQCGEDRDKVYALIGLLDNEGREMITPNYESSLQEVFVNAAAALIVSYWRRDASSKDVPSLPTYYGLLNTALGLPLTDIEDRITQAVEVATCYSDSLSDSMPGISFDETAQRSSESSRIAHEEVRIETPTRSPDVATLPAAEPLFWQALRKFKSRFTNAEMKELASTQRKGLDVTIARVQIKQRATGTLQNMTRLRGFLNAMEQYQEVLSSCPAVSDTALPIWGSMRLLLQTTAQRSDAFDGILSQYELLGESIPSLAHLQALSTDDQIKIIYIVLCNALEFHRLALYFFKKPAWKELFTSSWYHLQTEIKELIDDVRKQKSAVLTEANARELQEARQGREQNRHEYSELLRQTNQVRIQTEANFRRLDAAEILRRRTYLYDWLSAPDTESDHEHLQTVITNNDDGGKWFLRMSKFRAWFDPSSASAPLLWVTGKPGAGKSVLASLVIDEASQLEHTTTLFFYCKHDDEDKNKFLGMARSILRQLLQKDETLLIYLFDVATKKGDARLRTVKLAREMLTTCLKAVGKTYVIIDGIDECEPTEQQHIARFWMTYVENSGSDSEPSRCALFSQEDASTRPLFCRLPTIRVQGEHHDKDIRSYCIAAATKLRKKFSLAPYEESQIASETARRAQGMFLFARLVMRNLLQQLTKARLLREIEHDVFPRDLNGAYDRIMDTILQIAPPPNHEYARRLLAWTTCAARVLKWREIQAALSIDLNLQMIDFESHQLREDSKTLCGALIEELPNGDVTFVHSTVRPYLIKFGYVKPEQEHAELVELCLNYLNLPAFSMTWSEHDVRNALREGTYAFMEYAIASWTTHLEQLLDLLSDSILPTGLAETLQTFFRLHWKEPRKRSKPTKRITEITNKIHSTPIYDKVKDSMSSMHCLMSTNLSDLDAVQPWDIFTILARVRSLMESMALQPDLMDDLEQFYGDQLYKCPRVYCKWFHEGFSDGHIRQTHIDKHERSHYCSSLGCTYATLGFPTAKELAKHVADLHNDGWTENDFPPIIEESDEPEDQEGAMDTSQPVEQVIVPERTEKRTAQRAANVEPAEQQRKEPNEPGEPIRRRRKGPSTYECDRCHKRFPRAFGLRSHMKTHVDVLEFECNICKKQFARQRDCKRHEEAHSGEKKFVCHGNLKNGGTWGCRRRFARADALGRHHRSEAGRNCIQPMVDEDKETQNNAGRLQQPRSGFMVNGHNDTTNAFPGLMDADNYFLALPQQQYPDFSNSSWAYPATNNDPGSSEGLHPFPSFGEPSSSAGSTAFQDQHMNYGDYDLPMSSSNDLSTGFRRSNYLDNFESR